MSKHSSQHSSRPQKKEKVTYLAISFRNRDGLHRTQVFFDTPLVIGRSEQADLTLPYPWISLQHVEIHWSSKGIQVRDLYAKSPARLQGQTLSSQLSTLRPSLTLSLPSISLDLKVCEAAKESVKELDSAHLTKLLWRPESGYLLWSFSGDQKLHLKQHPTQTNQRMQRGIEDHTPQILPAHSWQINRQRRASQTAYDRKQVQQQQFKIEAGQYWFIRELGKYELSSTESDAPLFFSLSENRSKGQKQDLAQSLIATSALPTRFTQKLRLNIESSTYQLTDQGHVFLWFADTLLVFNQNTQPPSMSEYDDTSPKLRTPTWWRKFLEAIS